MTMRDYDELVKALRMCDGDVGACLKCPRYGTDDCHGVFGEAADAIEEMLAGLERYRHAAFVISETCVEESKCHISPEEAIKKIRENIYYFRQMPLPEPPKEVVWMVRYDPYTDRFIVEGDCPMSPRLGDQPKEVE